MDALSTRPDWMFLSNHGHVLVYLSRHPEARIRDIALAIGITERRTQAILADLAASNFVFAQRSGRRNSYTINRKRRLRHPQEADTSVGDFLNVFG